ncbi:MAG: hypothetical protein NTV01_01165 [Bacteroidia bacterium]|nr:hypothetical protein [Bacteroidia bacterium]
MKAPDTLQTYLWPGLAPYQEHDRHLFYGRDAEIFDLTRKILNSKLTILFGPSGTGKTSLLQAGVFPKLRKQNLLPVTARLEFPLPGETITPVTVQLGGALKCECQKEGIIIKSSDNQWFNDRIENLSLWEWLRSFTLEGAGGAVWQPVFMFDQFEEIFTLGKYALGLESFLRQIGDAAENFLPEEINHRMNEENAELAFDPAKQPYKVVIALRDDYFAQLQSLRQILPGVTVRQNHFSLVRLTGSQALAAITGPAPAGMISHRVAVEIIRFVANASENLDNETLDTRASLDRFEVEPAILSLVCQQLNIKRQSQEQQTITVDFVKQSKGRILEEFYETAMQSVKPETRYYIENQLLDAEGFRTSEPESNLIQQHIPQEDIQLLINLRLLHRIELYQRSHLELSHDVMAPVVKASRDTRLQREEAENQKMEAEKRKAEIARLKKQRRRSMVLVGSFGIITVLALIAVFFGMQKQRESNAQRLMASSLVFINESSEMSTHNTGLAIRFAQLANQLDSSSFSANNILKVSLTNNFWSNSILKGHQAEVRSAVFSPDGERILTASVDSTA